MTYEEAKKLIFERLCPKEDDWELLEAAEIVLNETNKLLQAKYKTITLDLVKVIDPKGKVQYFGVNDKHYDGMLASGDIPGYSWEPVGEVTVEGHILEEEHGEGK